MSTNSNQIDQADRSGIFTAEVSSANKLAVDIGGTFTDIVLLWQGRLHSTKLLTTHDAPARAVLDGIKEIITQAGARLADIQVVLHGTTLATNALIERRGATTALLTTEGHRDVLEMAHENRFEQYDLNIVRPAPLVARHLRLPIAERLDAAGQVRLPLDVASVDKAIDVLREHEVESVAIGFLHAYANADHEQQVADYLIKALPALSLSLSSEVCPEIREYERLSTTVANSYVRPLMASYLADLENGLRSSGCTAPLLLMTSGGGLTTAETAARFPIRLVESGPAGGAILAASHAQKYADDRVLAFDMGGTTAKLTLIDDGEPLLSRAFEVDRQYRFKKGSGLPVRIPVIEMVEIGAGGGSIASRDALERVCVGPRSAGSSPGPACYGLGGNEPTVTDADVVLGKLNPAAFAGGRMQLDVEAARHAMAALEIDSENISPSNQAHAVCEVVDENMAAAAKAHASEWGKDVEGRTLIAFGGAAPLHAARLARKLNLKRILIPAGAGVGSALGFLAAPISFEVVRSRYTRLAAFSAGLLDGLTTDMHAEALAVIKPALAPDAPLIQRRRAFMRYVGQGYEIAVDLDEHEGVDDVLSAHSLRCRFEAAYAALYTRTIPGLEVEILSWTLSLASPSSGALTEAPPVASQQAPSVPTEASPAGDQWALFDPETLKRHSAQMIERSELRPGVVVAGPALVTEAQTTTFVPSGANVELTHHGDLIVCYV